MRETDRRTSQVYSERLQKLKNACKNLWGIQPDNMGSKNWTVLETYRWIIWFLALLVFMGWLYRLIEFLWTNDFAPFDHALMFGWLPIVIMLWTDDDRFWR